MLSEDDTSRKVGCVLNHLLLVEGLERFNQPGAPRYFEVTFSRIRIPNIEFRIINNEYRRKTAGLLPG